MQGFLMTGALMGDVSGSWYEWHNTKEKPKELITDRDHFTDDSVLTYAVADGILRGLEEANRSRLFVDKEMQAQVRSSIARPSYSFDVSCEGSVPQAIEAFLEGEDFSDVIRLAISIGGDSDTIAAIAGSLAEAYEPAPEELRERALAKLDDFLRETVARISEPLTPPVYWT
jgi:ADP-ribosylglycohydrolase